MKIDQSTLDWDWVKNIRAGSGVGMKIDRASVAFRAADAGHLDTILTVRNVLRNGCERPSTTLYWARWQNRYIFIVDKEAILNGVEKYLHETLAYLLLPSRGRRSGEEMAAEDLEAGTPEMSTCQNRIGNPLYLPHGL